MACRPPWILPLKPPPTVSHQTLCLSLHDTSDGKWLRRPIRRRRRRRRSCLHHTHSVCRRCICCWQACCLSNSRCDHNFRWIRLQNPAAKTAPLNSAWHSPHRSDHPLSKQRCANGWTEMLFKCPNYHYFLPQNSRYFSFQRSKKTTPPLHITAPL